MIYNLLRKIGYNPRAGRRAVIFIDPVSIPYQRILERIIVHFHVLRAAPLRTTAARTPSASTANCGLQFAKSIPNRANAPKGAPNITPPVYFSKIYHPGATFGNCG
jgi:hypothetical protein